MKYATLGPKLRINISNLIETRLLIQANSGGGKSYAIRKLLEETHGLVQQIVLDMEGEFGSLRESFDYILAGKGGDIPADPRSAALLAKKILELETSLIVDLYELKKHDRILFVKNFVEALVNAPKELWHPVLVVIDEAHVFVPEKGESAAMSAVVDLATRGRKRGFAAVLATQRLSKLNKDVAAELGNKLIGRTGLDIDMKRAGEELGFTSRADTLELRKMQPGEFYAFGPSITDEPTRYTIGEVKTSHPKAGKRLDQKVPPPAAKVKAILSKLTDLPKEAEQEIRDVQTLTARVRELERAAKQTKPVIDEDALKREYGRGFAAAAKQYGTLVEKANATLGRIKKFLAGAEEIALPELTKASPPTYIHPAPVTRAPAPARAVRVREPQVGERSFGRCERSILKFLAMREDSSFSKVQIGAMTGYSHGSGGFNNALSNLTQASLIIRAGDRIGLNPQAQDDVREILGADYSSPGRESLEIWLSKDLGKCAREIYQKLLEDPEPISKERLGEITGYSPGSGGFNNAISRLNTLGLVQRTHNGIQINQELLGL